MEEAYETQAALVNQQRQPSTVDTASFIMGVSYWIQYRKPNSNSNKKWFTAV